MRITSRTFYAETPFAHDSAIRNSNSDRVRIDSAAAVGMSTRPWKTAIHVPATLNYLRAGNPFDIARSTSPRSSAKLATVHLCVNTVLGTQQGAGLAGFFLSNIPTTVAPQARRAHTAAPGRRLEIIST